MNNRIAGFTKVRMFTETLMGLHQAFLVSGGSLAGTVKHAKHFQVPLAILGSCIQ